MSSTWAISLVSADSTPSYCTISNIHVSSLTPTDYSSTTVHVTTSFSIYCTGSPGTVWRLQTKLFAESNLLGVNEISSSENQYSAGQGTAQYVASNQFDAMNYYGYGDQTPSLYVQITAINTSTGSLDAQQQAPFAVDTSQYPFNLNQQNYCHFPALSPYFQLLPGCGAKTNNTSNVAPSSSNCNLYGLPQFLQPYLPGCSGTSMSTSNQTTTVTQFVNAPIAGTPLTSPDKPSTPTGTEAVSNSQAMQAISGIIITALATFLGAALMVKKSPNLIRNNFMRLKPQGKFCTECGMHLLPTENFCTRCGEPSPNAQETYRFRLQPPRITDKVPQQELP